MECKCPNCKGDARRSQIDGVEYIECKACGWFEVTPGGECQACDPPQQTRDDTDGAEPVNFPQPVPSDPKAPSSLIAGDDGGGSPPPPEPADDDDDEGGIEFELTDEVDY